MKAKVTFFDLETTDGNPATAEVLTGFFHTLIINFKDGTYVSVASLYVECKPIKFIPSSTRIHGITQDRANTFGDKRSGLRQICEYIKEHAEGFFCCHANARIFGKHGHFDWTVIQNDLYNISEQAYWWFKQNFAKAKVISTHTIAKKLLGLDYEENLELKKLVAYYGLPPYREHVAEDDVDKALIPVFLHLVAGMDIESEPDLFDLGHYSGTKHWTRNGFLI
jgi:DNA polymerase III epsilon subunit-like protein